MGQTVAEPSDRRGYRVLHDPSDLFQKGAVFDTVSLRRCRQGDLPEGLRLMYANGGEPVEVFFYRGRFWRDWPDEGQPGVDGPEPEPWTV